MVLKIEATWSTGLLCWYVAFPKDTSLAFYYALQLIWASGGGSNLNYIIGHLCSNRSNGHQGDMPYYFVVVPAIYRY